MRVIVLTAVLLLLLGATQVNLLPVPEDWQGLVQRTKRSLLWRWNNMKPVGSLCRDHQECGTKKCRKKICSF